MANPEGAAGFPVSISWLRRVLSGQQLVFLPWLVFLLEKHPHAEVSCHQWLTYLQGQASDERHQPSARGTFALHSREQMLCLCSDCLLLHTHQVLQAAGAVLVSSKCLLILEVRHTQVMDGCSNGWNPPRALVTKPIYQPLLHLGYTSHTTVASLHAECPSVCSIHPTPFPFLPFFSSHPSFPKMHTARGHCSLIYNVP